MNFLKTQVLRLLILLTLLHVGRAQLSVCTFTPTQIATHTAMTLQGTALLNSGAVTGINTSYSVLSDDINLMGMRVEKNGGAGPDIEIDFTVEIYDTSTSPDQINVTLTLTNLATSGGPITSAFMSVDLGSDSGVDAIWSSGVPSGATLTDRYNVEFTFASIAVGDSETIQFLAEPAGTGGIEMKEGQSFFDASLYFTHLGTTYGTVFPEVCVERETTIIENAVYQHGFTALTFFVVFFAAIGLTILGIYIFLAIQRRRRDATVSPSDERRIRDKGKKIVMDAKEAMKRGGNTIKDFSLIAWDDSLVYVLALKDKLHMQREIDNLDILSTIYVDTEIETEQTDAAVQASLLLVQGLRHNGDISKATEDKANSTMQGRLRDLDRKLDAEYKGDLEAVYVDIEARNKERLGDLFQQHKRQRQEVVAVSKDLPEMERKKVMELIDQEQLTEENELTYKLALEQNLEAEKLRKEYAIRKRIGIKEIQQQFIGDVVDEGKLNMEKSEWLMKQHREQQEEIHRKYDDEISRQRMNLEEKLARRRALALASETQEDDNTETLNSIASLQITLLAKLRKASVMSTDQNPEYMTKVQSDLHDVKDRMNSNKEARQNELFKRLSQAKQKVLAEKMKEQAAELNRYVTSSKSLQADGAVDPVSYVEGLVSIKSRHRKELCVLDDELDAQQAKELENLREEAVKEASEELAVLERDLIEKLTADGMADGTIEKIIASHKKNLNDMTARQKANRQDQEAKLKDELARRKREWEARRTSEKKEQMDLREHEAEVVEKLLSSQVAFSESERQRILKEHEKQMVLFENSLTLNKLRQKQMLEEKIAQRKARQIEDLQQKQNAEILKHRKMSAHNGEDDDDETNEKEMALLKKHTQQRIAAMHTMDINIDAEVQEVEAEMNKERALALKGQEEKLGALIASLQMNKAREMARIDEQQKAINSLKANLMDDLNSRGILSTPECEKVLSIHKEEQEKLTQRLDGQRSKQEQMIHRKLQERLAQREKSMLEHQETEMENLMKSAANKSSANIHRMILMHKHMVAMEKFRNKMEREISQTLENTKRDFELQKQEIFQEQEMQFLAGLVKISEIDRNELIDVLHMLFPGKTEEAIMDMLAKIYQQDPLQKFDADKKSSQRKLQRQESSLADRIYTAQYSNPTPLHRRGSVMTMFPPKDSEPAKKGTRKGSQVGMRLPDSMSQGFSTSGQGDNPLNCSYPQQQFGPMGDFTERLTKTEVDPSPKPMRRQSKATLGNDRRPSAVVKAESQRPLYEDEYRENRRYSQVKAPNRKLNHNGDSDEDEEEERDRKYKSYSKNQRKFNHNDDDDDSEDERQRIAQSRRSPKVNHNGDDEDEDEDDYDDVDARYRREKAKSQRSQSSGRLPPLRDQPTGKKKKSKLLKKLAHQDDDY